MMIITIFKLLGIIFTEGIYNNNNNGDNGNNNN